MGDDDDVGFRFDPKPFLKGVNDAAGGIKSLGETTSKIASGMGKAFQWALVKVEALKIIGRSALGTVKEFLPELGKTFNIAKDIFFKNFLWPLRQAIAPYLQKLLDWVRDNRTVFVKWGAVVANIFKVVVSIVKDLWGVLVSVAKAIAPIVKGDISAFVNLLLTKVAVLVAWIAGGISSLISAVKGPVGEVLLDIAALAKNVWDFVSGLFKANDHAKSMATFFKDIGGGLKLAFDSVLTVVNSLLNGVKASELKNMMTPLSGIAASFKGLMKTLNDLVGSPGGKGVAEWLGKNMGNNIQQSLILFAVAIEAVVDAIQWLIEGIKMLTALKMGQTMEEVGAMAKALAGEQKARWAPLIAAQAGVMTSSLENFGMMAPAEEQAHDAIVTKEGRVIHTDPADDIFAVMRRTRTGQTDREPARGGMQVSFGNIQLTVPPGWTGFTPDQAGDITEQFRSLILGARIAGGTH
jgi:hypothetical protein